MTIAKRIMMWPELDRPFGPAAGSGCSESRAVVATLVRVVNTTPNPENSRLRGPYDYDRSCGFPTVAEQTGMDRARPNGALSFRPNTVCGAARRSERSADLSPRGAAFGALQKHDPR